MERVLRFFVIGLSACLCLALTAKFVRGQEDKKADDEKAYKALLDRAEEEYRRFFTKPEKPHEFWAAMKFELDTGKFELAALHLKLLLEQPKEETDKELVKIAQAQGMFPFLRLRSLQKWSKDPIIQKDAMHNVEVLLERVTTGFEKHLSDPDRIRKFIKNLDARTVEERTFAYHQLERARDRAVPYLVEALRTSGGKLREKIVEAMVNLPPETVPAFLEVLKARDAKDAANEEPRLTLLSIVQRRADKRAIPYLWHLFSAPQYPASVRAQAKRTLAYLTDTKADKLMPAEVALTEMAERYYRHKVAFPEARITKEERNAFAEAYPGQIPVVQWEWDGANLTRKIEPLPAVEAKYGLRYAREAMDLDAGYRPAQIVFLNITLDRAFAGQLDKFVSSPTPPALQRLLATIDANLLQTLLEQAMDDHRVSVILPVIRALGDRGEVRAARSPGDGPPRGIVKALYYPDRRVQFAALQAMLRMPAGPVPVASTRVVELLRRFVAADSTPRALLLFAPIDKTMEIRAALKTAGFETKAVATTREAFQNLGRAADVDVILLHHAGNAELPHALAQLRADADQGGLPLFLIADKDREAAFIRLAERYPRTWVIKEVEAAAPDLKNTTERRIQETAGAKLTADERKAYTQVALDTLWRMARGEITGYDIRPAEEPVARLVPNEDLGVQALEILGRLPGQMNQKRLAAIVLDAGLGKIRNTAARELNRHVQKHGLLIDRDQVQELRHLYASAKEDSDLRGQLALVLSQLRPSAVQTGARLQDFQPDPPPAPPKKENKKDKEP